MAFGTRLRALRRERAFTLASLADASQISKAQLSRYERGLRPSLDAIGRLAPVLGVSVGDLAMAAAADLDAEPVEAGR